MQSLLHQVLAYPFSQFDGKMKKLTLYAGAKSPGKDKVTNWLPAPNGSFSLYIRCYWPKQEVVNGSWKPPKVVSTWAISRRQL